MIGQKIVYQKLKELGIDFKYYESPRDFSTEDDGSFWKQINATRCKNLFMRNHKGNRHFLIISDYYRDVDIRILEQKFKKGKISFASQKRIDKWIKGMPGAISVFNLFNDTENHVEVFIDETLKTKSNLTFLPNELNALLAISFDNFIKILENSGNYFEFLNLSDLE
ncbi:MAG: YbaK/EbsC family protein [Bacteroidales bacterium]|nr:YbaK/EbsC family protein [Bacteroidales bacterium]MDD4217588.1 YbaK/EbsC family protein [Bacteroidales bacterium]MDY0142369.1 YbaK/EbsC family protein [Bacteroidales bacterium]